jgi:hypothetical protein
MESLIEKRYRHLPPRARIEFDHLFGFKLNK